MQVEVARPPRRNVEDRPDTGPWSPASDHEAAEVLCDAIGIDFEDLRDGRRRWRVNNRLNYYRLLARKYFATGGRTHLYKRTAIAAALYDDVACLADMRRKESALQRCEKDLVAAGLIRVETVMGRRGGLLITLLNPTFDGYTPASRGCSSVGSSTTRQLTLVRSRETRREIHQHRVQPWRRKTGRRGPQRLQLVFFAPKKIGDYGFPSNPYGVEGKLRGCTRGRGPASLDAPPPGRGTAAGAAPGGPWMDGHERMWLETLEADFERLLGPPLDGRLLHPERLLTALRRLDRWANFGQGRVGAGVEVAQRLIESHADQLADEWDEYRRQLRRAEPWDRAPRAPRPKPRHLGYFVPALLQLGRRWRRTHRPRRRRDREIRPGSGSRDRGPHA